MSDIETALRRAVAIHGSIRKASQELEFSQDAASRVLKGEGVGSENLKRFREALGLPQDAPLRHSAVESDTVRAVPASVPLPVAVPRELAYWLGRLEEAGGVLDEAAARHQRIRSEMRAALFGLSPDAARDALVGASQALGQAEDAGATEGAPRPIPKRA